MSIWGLFSLTAITVNATNSNVSNGLFGGYSGSAGSVTITNGVLDAVVIDGAAGNAAVRGDFTAGGATPTLMVTSNAVTVENGTNVHMGGNQVHGVANGLAAYDAVNVQQLHNLERMLSGGIAASTAVSNIPPVESGQTFSFGVGLGHYNDRSALALGCAYRFSPNGQVRASLASGLGGGAKTQVGIGAGWSCLDTSPQVLAAQLAAGDEAVIRSAAGHLLMPACGAAAA